MKDRNHRVLLHELIHQRYSEFPYGWPPEQTLLLLAQMAAAREIDFLIDKTVLPLESAFDTLDSPSKRKQVIVSVREAVDASLVREAQLLGHTLFGHRGPDGEEELFHDLQSVLREREQELSQYQSLASTGAYPGRKEIEDARATLGPGCRFTDSARFFKWFVEHRPDLTEFDEDFQELNGFYKQQRGAWESLRAASSEFEQNQHQLERSADAKDALIRMRKILAEPRPYGMIHEGEALIAKVRAVNEQLVSAAREESLSVVDRLAADVQKEAETAKVDSQLVAGFDQSFMQLRDQIQQQASIPHIDQFKGHAEQVHGSSLDAIAAAIKPGEPAPKPRVTIDARIYAPTGCIESMEQAESFMNGLSAAIKKELDRGSRIDIR